MGAAPVWLREEVGTRLGARVAGALTQVGGLPPGVAARLGWVAPAFEDVDGTQSTLPWRPGQLRRVLEMVATMAAAPTPAPPGLPTLRALQVGQGVVALDWLRRRTG